LGQQVCHDFRPLCGDCKLNQICKYGRKELDIVQSELGHFDASKTNFDEIKAKGTSKEKIKLKYEDNEEEKEDEDAYKKGSFKTY
jgi:hypothetical protein